MNKSLLRDLKLFGVGFLIAAIFLGLLIFDYWKGSQSEVTNKDPIGFVSGIDRDVRRRVEGEINWTELEAKKSVYWGDTIFIGSKSSASIKLKSGQVLTLKENTLIVLNTNQEQPEISLKFGQVSTELNGKSLLIKTMDGVTEAKGHGIIESQVKGLKGLNVKSVKGNLVLKNKKGEHPIAVNKTYVVDKEVKEEKVKVEVPVCRFDEPSISERSLPWEPNSPVELKWIANSEACGHYEVLIFKGESFDAPSETILSDELRLAYLPKEALEFYWQVFAKNIEGKELARSLRQKITLVLPKPSPTPLAAVTPKPSLVAKVELKTPSLDILKNVIQEADVKGQLKKTVEVNVSWERVPKADLYILEYATTPDFKDKAVVKEKGLNARIKIDSPEKYFVRLYAVAKKADEMSKSSVTRSFTYRLLDPIPRPEKCLPRDSTTFAFAEEKPMQLSWSGGTKDQSFELEFAKDRDFKKRKTSHEGEGSLFTITEKNMAGRYFWRVRHINKATGQKSPWSQVHTFSIVSLLSEEPPE